ncbi:MAG TPA: type II secretion system protein GspJ [Tepidisphaeraceae bacterium]|jgi:type II secretion system protein J|nr:type II secretion system protein GspJ [Tepidisphaeraceae bacterium]
MTRAPDNLRSNRRSGFTLLELVIALAMVTIIVATLASSLSLAYHATQRTEAAIAPSRQAAIALDYMSDDLQSALPRGTELAGNFEGTQAQDDRGHEADDLIFYSTAESPQHVDANGEIKEIEITVEHPLNSSDYVLVRRVTRNLLTDVQPAPDEEIICRGVSSFTLQYFNGSSWNPTWDSTQEDNTIPAAVQVTLELQEPAAGGKMRTIRYDRIFPLSCSTAAIDPAVNSGVTP